MRILFRREVYPAGDPQNSAAILDISRNVFAYCMIGVLLLLIAITVYFVFGSYAPKKTVAGYLVSDNGLVQVHAPFSATVLERFVVPGATVAAGDPLYGLAAQQSIAQTGNVGHALIATLTQRKELLLAQQVRDAQAAKLEFDALQTRKAAIEQQLAILGQELDSRRAAVILQEKGLTRLQRMLADGVIAKARFEEEKAALLERRAALSAVEGNLLRSRAERADIESKIKLAPVRSAQQQTEYDKQLAALEQELLRVTASSNAIIRAPVAGVVSGLVYEPGQHVTPQLPLLNILPEGSQMQARLLVPSRAIGLIEPGQTVNLRYRAFPYQQYGAYHGTVRRVSRSAISSQDANLPLAVQEPVYLVTVELANQTVRAYGKQFPLQAGMLLEADIVVGHMRLYEWFLQPLYRLQGSL